MTEREQSSFPNNIHQELEKKTLPSFLTAVPNLNEEIQN